MRILDALVAVGVLTQATAIDSTYVKVHRSAHGGVWSTGRGVEHGATCQAVARSHGGQTDKIHVITDLLGRPAVIRLTPGNVGDIRAISDLMVAAGPLKRLIVDKG